MKPKLALFLLVIPVMAVAVAMMTASIPARTSDDPQTMITPGRFYELAHQIQELQGRVASLETRIISLEEKVKDLERKLAEQQAPSEQKAPAEPSEQPAPSESSEQPEQK